MIQPIKIDGKTPQGKPLTLAFPAYPDPCTAWSLKAQGQPSFMLTAGALGKSTQKSLSAFADALGGSDGVVSVTFDSGATLTIERDAVSVSYHGKEQAYWSADEFDDYTQSIEVLGAIAGALTSEDEPLSE